MKALLDRKTAYREITRRQDTILEELAQLKTKMKMLGSLRRFEELAQRGRKFAKLKGLTERDVLKND